MLASSSVYNRHPNTGSHRALGCKAGKKYPDPAQNQQQTATILRGVDDVTIWLVIPC